MTNKTFRSSIFAIGAVLISSAALADGTGASSSGQMTSNGSSTGVGNAGSFGIGSGTANGDATATATSNGMVDNSVDNSTNRMTIAPVASQDLEATNTNNHVTVNGSPNTSISVGASAFPNYTGILTNGFNTAATGNAIAATNLSVNGSVAGK